MERRKPLSPHEFVKYIAKPIKPKEMDLWVKSNNINVEKTQLFFDYICSLYNIMSDTYLGIDSIITQEDMLGHFNWCWSTIIENFGKENILFEKDGPHHEYFFNFFYESFYTNKHEEQREKIKEFLNHLFTLYSEKTKSELDMLYEMYVLLNESLTVKQ